MQEHNELVHADNDQTDTTSLQPMSFTDILDGMFSFYRSHIGLFLAIAAVYLVLGFAIDQISTLLIRANPGLGASAVIGFSAICTAVVSIIVVNGLVFASAHVYLGREITQGSSLQQAWRRFWPFLGSTMLWGLVVGGLMVTIIGIPFAIYFWIRWGMYSLPVLFEETTARNALRRSTELVKNTWWRVFGIMLAISVISFMITFLFGASSGFLLSLAVMAEASEPTSLIETFRRLFIPTISEMGWFAYSIRRLFTLGIAALTMPIAPIGSTLLYFDLRIRKEAYDIEVQASN